MVGNEIVQCELLLISIFQFLRPQSMAAILNFSETLKKLLAYLYIAGNVIVKLE